MSLGISSEGSNSEVQNSELKKVCIEATIRGIQLEIKRFNNLLEKSENSLSPGAITKEEIKRKLKKLYADLEKYKKIKLDDYTLPEKREVIAWIENACLEGTLLYVKNMTRSGPFYYVVGIRGNDCERIKPKTEHRMTIYLVYPRYYPFPSYYVYIHKITEVGKR